MLRQSLPCVGKKVCLINVFRISVVEPWFGFLKTGEKRIEGRLRSGKYAGMKAGDEILVLSDDGDESFTVVVEELLQFPSFEAFLTVHLSEALPGVKSVQEGVAIYHQFYTPEQEAALGILAIRVSKS